MTSDFVIFRSADLIANCSGLLITAGAGMGVDSGLPDFRGNEGFWRSYPALGKAGIEFTAIANPDAFRTKPRRAWGFYGHRLALYRDTKPHAGFEMLHAIAARLEDGAFVCTSNVDGQFQKSGFAPEKVWEIHGSIHHLQCLHPCSSAIWSADNLLPEVDLDRCELVSELPRCPSCGALVRPNILMFDDGDWIENRTDSQQDQFMRWSGASKRLVVIELGAGTAIPSIRRLGEGLGVPLIRVNVREPEVSKDGDIGVAASAMQFLQCLGRELEARGFFG